MILNPSDTLDDLFSIDDLLPTEDEVLSTLLTLNTSKDAGPDGFSNHFLKTFASTIMKPLLHTFRVSLQSGVFTAGFPNRPAVGF